MIKKLFVSLSVSTLVGGLLVGCTVSDEERLTCESMGGTVTSERYEEADGKRSGSLHHCASDAGVILEVYNTQIFADDIGEGFFSASERNRQVFEKCEAVNGETYRTSRKTGKIKKTLYLCVVDGNQRSVLSES